jgi:hypothetical protein
MRHELNARITTGLEPFWSALVPAGQTATVIDMPYVPLVQAPGFRSVTGWGLHDEMVPLSYPADFRPWIIKRYGKHMLKADTVEPHAPGEKLHLAEELRTGALQRVRLLEDLAARQDWNLLLAVFGEVHQSGHYLAADEQLSRGTTNVDAQALEMRDYDEQLPRLLQAAGRDCSVMILAIHGMVEQREYEVMGSLAMALFSGRSPADWYAHPDLLRRIRDLVPDSLHRAVWRRLPSTWRESRQNRISTSNSDLEHDRLFSVIHETHTAVRVNLAGREQKGFVREEEVPALLDQLDAFTRGFHTEEGEPAFTGIWRTAEHEPGSRLHLLPDALILANPELKAVTKLIGPDGVKLTSEREEARNGVHDGRGFCFFRPASGSKAATRTVVDNLDFAPSALDLLGVDPAREYAGRSFIG